MYVTQQNTNLNLSLLLSKLWKYILEVTIWYENWQQVQYYRNQISPALKATLVPFLIVSLRLLCVLAVSNDDSLSHKLMRFYPAGDACQPSQADIPHHARWTHACNEALTLGHMRKQFRITLWEVVLTGDIKSWHKAGNWRDTLRQLRDVYLYQKLLENSFFPFYCSLISVHQACKNKNKKLKCWRKVLFVITEYSAPSKIMSESARLRTRCIFPKIKNTEHCSIS